jgi:hypothetical protein
MLNKLVLRAFLTISLALSFTGANAALITQDIISDTAGGIIGSITIDTVNVDEFDTVNDWVSFDFFGYELAQPAFVFFAEIDIMDFSAGIQFLQFDANDICANCEWAYSGVVEAGLDNGTVSVFDATTDDIIFFYEDVRFGDATVVPTPATLVLFLTAIAGLAVRRKNRNNH